MDTPLIGVGGFLVALGLIFLRVPVAVAMGLVGVVGFAIVNGFFGVSFVMGAAPFEAVFPYGLSVVPLFVLMGVVTAHSGLSRSLYKAVNAFVGHRRGGLAMATVGACAGFGAISGSSLATVATMCRVSLPEMRRHGYDDRLAAGSIAAGGTLGVLIPPSILLVLYGILTELSIGRLFLAALLPGALATLLYMAAVSVQTRLNPSLGPAAERMPWGERLVVLKDVWGIVLLFALVLGGIYLGWFSPTEAAAVGAFGAFAIALLRRQLSLSVFRTCLTETAGTTGMIFFILIGAAVFNYFIETTNLPQMLVAAAQGADLNRYVVLALVMLFYLVLGCFMDSLSMILLTVPFVFPLVEAMDFNGIWFGILLVTVAELGLITPPVGMNLFVLQGVAPELRMQTIVRGVAPFLAADLVRLVILIALPPIALWLPSLVSW